MGTPYIAEIKVVSFNFPPKGWALCNGQLLPINQNQALFSILGTTYGGNGQTTFALPNLQGRVPIHRGAGFVLGQAAGEYAHTLNIGEMPQHTHPVQANSKTGTRVEPGASLWAASTSGAYASTPTVGMNPQNVSPAGGSQPHENTPPYLTVNFVIALVGIFPSQN